MQKKIKNSKKIPKKKTQKMKHSTKKVAQKK